MSIETIALRMIELAMVVLVAMLAVTAARAAEVVFRPSLSFGLFHDGNVNVVNYDPTTQTATTERGDDSTGLAVDLTVDRNTANSSLSFSYKPAYRKYREATELDFLENAVVFSYSREMSSGNRIAAAFDALHSESQGVRSFNADRPLTFVPRTALTRGQADLSGTAVASRRSFFDWGVRYGVNRYDAVAGVTFQDDSYASARGGWRYALSARGTLGVGVDAGWIRYSAVTESGETAAGSVPDVVTETLNILGTQSVGRSTELDYSAGVTRSSSDPGSSLDGTFQFAVSRRVAELSELRAGVGRGVGPGGGFSGASLDTGGWVAFSHNPQRRGLGGSITGGYWFREGVETGATSTGHATTLDVTGSLGWSFSDYLALNADYAYVNQGTTGTSSSALDSRYSIYGVHLRWAFLGR